MLPPQRRRQKHSYCIRMPPSTHHSLMRCVLALYDHRLAGIGLDRLEEDREGFPELHSSRHKMALVDNLTSLHGSRCIRIIGQKRAGC
jgi:hypothetical protein